MFEPTVVRTERHMQGNKAVQTTRYSSAETEAQGAAILLCIIVALMLTPFAVLLWSMYTVVSFIRQAGGHPMLGIVIAATMTLGIVFLVTRFRPLRYVYIAANAVVVASMSYTPLAHNNGPDAAAVVAAILFLLFLVGGVFAEIEFEQSEAGATIRNIYGIRTAKSVT